MSKDSGIALFEALVDTIIEACGYFEKSHGRFMIRCSVPGSYAESADILGCFRAELAKHILAFMDDAGKCPTGMPPQGLSTDLVPALSAKVRDLEQYLARCGPGNSEARNIEASLRRRQAFAAKSLQVIDEATRHANDILINREKNDTETPATDNQPTRGIGETGPLSGSGKPTGGLGMDALRGDHCWPPPNRKKRWEDIPPVDYDQSKDHLDSDAGKHREAMERRRKKVTEKLHKQLLEEHRALMEALQNTTDQLRGYQTDMEASIREVGQYRPDAAKKFIQLWDTMVSQPAIQIQQEIRTLAKLCSVHGGAGHNAVNLLLDGLAANISDLSEAAGKIKEWGETCKVHDHAAEPVVSRPDDSLPDDSLPDDSLPDDSLPDDSLPDDSLPDVPQKSRPWKDEGGCFPDVSRTHRRDGPVSLPDVPETHPDYQKKPPRSPRGDKNVLKRHRLEVPPFDME